MNRSHIVVIAVIAALIGVLVPAAASVYLSWVLAVRAEKEWLSQIARRVIIRTDQVAAEARATLKALAETDATPCSEEHIARMHLAAVNSHHVKEVGYLKNGEVKCTSWGRITQRINTTVPDFNTAEGFAVWLAANPQAVGGKHPMVIQYRDHYTVLAPASLVDVIIDRPDVRLALIREAGNLVIATLNDPDAGHSFAIPEGRDVFEDDRMFYAVARDANGLLAVAAEPHFRLTDSWRRQGLLVAPLGVLTAGLMVGAVMWMSRRRLSPLGELEVAVRRREFEVHYQPLMNLASGSCIGAEALVRWRRPDGSMVRPDLFIPLAEESGLIQPITDQVIARVVSDLGALLVARRDLHIAINLAAVDLQSERVLAVIQRLLAGTGIETQQIWLEATERGFMNADATRNMIAAARAAGHAVAIDDFGTGYSSLSRLQSFELDALKIDKSFVDTIGIDAAASSVAPHIIDMAKTLRLKIVAEGIETAVQAEFLRARGVDYGQGWLFAKAMPAAEFVQFAKRSPR